MGRRRHRAHGLFGIHQGFDAAVQRVHARAGIGHVVALPCGVHDRVQDFKQVVTVQEFEHFHQHANALRVRRLCPTVHRFFCGVEQRLDVRLRVDHAQGLLGVGRYFFADPVRDAGLVQFKTAVFQVLFESNQARAFGVHGLGVFVGHFRVRAPAVARGTGLLGAFKAGLVLFEEGRHQRLQISRWWRRVVLPGTRSDADRVSVPSAAKSMLRIWSLPTKLGFSAWLTW